MVPAIDFGDGIATLQGMAAIGERIRARRKALGLTQVTLASKLSIDQSTLSDIESKGAEFSARVLMRLSELLKVTPQFIMRGEDAPAPVPLAPEQLQEITATIQQQFSELSRADDLQDLMAVLKKAPNRIIRRAAIDRAAEAAADLIASRKRHQAPTPAHQPGSQRHASKARD